MTEQPQFLQQLVEEDPEFGEHVTEMFKKAGSEGALSPKTKTLMSMALDAALGHEEGVKALARKAREQGASQQEILETIEVVTSVCGIQGLATGCSALTSEE